MADISFSFSIFMNSISEVISKSVMVSLPKLVTSISSSYFVFVNISIADRFEFIFRKVSFVGWVSFVGVVSFVGWVSFSD